ncbi:hypothetical protein Vi05172_g6173 [Venturia inaequalis]|nr:hypothetical protein Vi05172_g6173 [Venturia inaequalis]
MKLFNFDIILNKTDVEPRKHLSAPTNPASTTDEAISLCYTSKQYTDLLLICQSNKTIPVHKIIICPQCSFIANALKKPWAKTKTNDQGEETPYIDFSSEQLETVQQMVEYFYRGNYSDTPLDPSKPAKESFHHGIERIREHVGVYILAKQYLIPPLATKALQKMQDLQYDHPTSILQSAALVELVRYIYDNTLVSEGNEVGSIVARLAAKYAKFILETPDAKGMNVFSLAGGQGGIRNSNSNIDIDIDDILVGEYIDAIAEKDEGLAEAMLLYEGFGREVVQVLDFLWVEGRRDPSYAPRWVPRAVTVAYWGGADGESGGGGVLPQFN